MKALDQSKVSDWAFNEITLHERTDTILGLGMVCGDIRVFVMDNGAMYIEQDGYDDNRLTAQAFRQLKYVQKALRHGAKISDNLRRFVNHD